MPNDFYEKTVEDIIFENKHIIHKYGLPEFKTIVFRQFVLPSGKKIDIFAFDLIDGHIFIDIYELKRYDINADAICQAYNYYTEVGQITAGKFKSVDINIVMIGRNYTPVMLFEKMNLPFSVYTYDYRLEGMRFQKHQERRFLNDANNDFCLGLWAFGNKDLYYQNGQPDTVNIASAYANWKNSNKDDHEIIVKKTGTIFSQPIIKEIIKIVPQVIEPKHVKTEVFPLQPNWTPEFAKEIPPDENMFDLDHDDCDFEVDPIEADFSDYESEIEEDDIQYCMSLTLDEKEELTKRLLYGDPEDCPCVVPIDDPEINKADQFIQNIIKKYA